MFLFKPEHVPMIVAHRPRRKTQTRRLHKSRRAIPGSQHWAQRGMTSATRFAKLLISRSWKEPLGAITIADALAEGYPSPAAYMEAFWAINKITSGLEQTRQLRKMVWCYEFGVIGVTEFGRREAANALGVQVWPRVGIWTNTHGFFEAQCDCGEWVVKYDIAVPRTDVEHQVRHHRTMHHSMTLANPVMYTPVATLIAPLIEVDSSPLPR